MENTFTSIPDVIDKLFGSIAKFKFIILNNIWPSKERIQFIKKPILFIISEFDELVPSSQMEELYKIAINSDFKSKNIIKRANHNDAWIKGKEDYFQKILNFLVNCQEKRATILNEVNMTLKDNENL